GLTPPPQSISCRRRPASASLSPYATLFRSDRRGVVAQPPPQVVGAQARAAGDERAVLDAQQVAPRQPVLAGQLDEQVRGALRARSEEHTSELQSRENLVCRLLLEKKKGSKS